MTLSQVIPSPAVRDLESGELINLPPMWEREGFELTQEHKDFANLANVIQEKLGERALAAYRLPYHHLAELTISEAFGGTFLGLKIPHKTLDGATGTMDTFAVHPEYPGSTFFEHTYFFGRGATETRSDPLPVNPAIESVVTSTLGQLCGPRVIEINHIRY